ncbi:glycoside hydrolase family 72 protein [Acephala macrosclerotiorum]|nr:glycoside hydrolase family 72 protein [Acephala macrosclerotiorum]
MFRSLLGIALLASFSTRVVLALPTISVKGSKFFADGQQFFLKGVAYQGTPADPLIDTNQCQLDAKSMQAIGTNSIRVYHVDPYGNHDGCMAAFSNAGIYVWLDLDTFNTTVIQTNPMWTQEQFFAFALVMDIFQGYDNLGGFWIGNEVINTASGSPSAPYIKAATADMKSYMAAKDYRAIPIGYSAADIAELRPMLQNYLACGGNYAQSIDFFGLNSYEWCGSATYQTSGYSNLQAMAEGYNIPIFFSETGCNVGGERTFQDQTAIFGPNMVGTWSGSIIYEWVEETNHYGLVNYPNGQIYSGAPTPIQPDYDNLMNVWKTISPSGVAEASYMPTLSAPACPMASAGWGVDGEVPLPTLGSGVVAAAATANQKPTPLPTTSSVRPSTSASSTSTGTVSTSSTTSTASLSDFVSSSAPSSAVPSSSTVPSLSSMVTNTSSSVLPSVRANAPGMMFKIVVAPSFPLPP